MTGFKIYDKEPQSKLEKAILLIVGVPIYLIGGIGMILAFGIILILLGLILWAVISVVV